MTIQVEWFDDLHRIVLFSLDKEWTDAELSAAIMQFHNMCRSVNHDQLIHLIIDMRSKTVAINPKIVKELQGSLENPHPHGGATVIVSNSQFIFALLNILAKTSSPLVRNRILKHFVMVPTIEEAEARVYQLMLNEIVTADTMY